MPQSPSTHPDPQAHAHPRTREPEAARAGGATQRTPAPGTNGRMTERDNQRILRIALVVVVLAFAGVLMLNAFWQPGARIGHSAAPQQAAPPAAASAQPGSGTPAPAAPR
ncbi:hypothetical protein PGB34_03555 [Xenophilus arseniciresistens]|uniref:Uncharacterized protein n=1 Tax=Xenophilus arseniciresistens TaxID=1283306 RepID=A0AAE3SZ35_9BURK|nr:hypothetical protein [Xenophilus arseniciresistens]MDA7415431.1 hypothetical protein [Xenophilus arseniciresistens]